MNEVELMCSLNDAVLFVKFWLFYLLLLQTHSKGHYFLYLFLSICLQCFYFMNNVDFCYPNISLAMRKNYTFWVFN